MRCARHLAPPPRCLAPPPPPRLRSHQAPASWSTNTIVLLPAGLIGKVMDITGDDIQVAWPHSLAPPGVHVTRRLVLVPDGQVRVLDCVDTDKYNTVRTVRESVRILTRDGACTLDEAKRVYEATGALPRKKMIKALKDNEYMGRIALLQG